MAAIPRIHSSGAAAPADTSVFDVPAGLLRIRDRDLRLAGIAKRDDQGRTLDVHALRTSFATLLSKGDVAPRTAQATLRHSDIRLRMQTYTNPRFCSTCGAPSTCCRHCRYASGARCRLARGVETARATGTDDIACTNF